MERQRLIATLAAGLLCAAGPASAEGLLWKMSSSLNFESGTYGTGTRTSSLYVPFTLRRSFGDAFASVTIPYVSMTSDGGVSNVGGRPSRTSGRGGAAGSRTTRSGLGDVILRGGYDVLRDDPHPLDLTVVAKAKAPTASRAKGLGTGEFDAGAGVELAKLVAPGWTVLADAYYTAIGDPPGVNLNNQLAVDAGFSRALRENLTLTVLLEASNALVPGEPGPRDVRAIVEHRFDETAAVFGGASVGLSDGSSDYGISLGGSLRF
ncbi:MAG: transporter [Elusimicrobiota bacterium]|nr:transporter [Elusimicrobiota bacterium]